MRAKISNAGFVVKSALLGASMLTLGVMAAAEAAAPVAPAAPATAAAQPAVPAPADKVAKIGEQPRLSAAAEAAFEKVKALTATHKDALAKDGKALLAAVDDEILAVQKKYDAATAQAKEQWSKQATALKTARDKLAAQLEALGAAKTEAWDAGRKNVEAAYRDLSAGIAAALNKLKV